MEKKSRHRSQMESYPSPAEREQIIRRRQQLMEKIVPVLFMNSDEAGKALSRLAQEYGPLEVERVLKRVAELSERPFLGEEAFLYRGYRRAFAQFGGSRRFLSKREFEKLYLEHTDQFFRRKKRLLFSGRVSARERELEDLLLINERTWSELFPPDPPLRPADFSAPPAGTYKSPLTELMRLGWKEDEERLARWSRKVSLWRPLIPDLERMALDEGLLSGWPADPASWAPMHALYMLGFLRAYSSAGRLLALLDRENDWLSDLLPDVWARMGPLAARPLWTYLEDRSHPPISRGVVMEGLRRMALKHPESRPETIRGLERLLREAPSDDEEANAYIAYTLGKLRAVKSIPVIRQAFDEGKIDPDIISLEDVLEEMGVSIARLGEEE